MSPQKSKALQREFESHMDGKWHPKIEWYYNEDLQNALEQVYNMGASDERQRIMQAAPHTALLLSNGSENNSGRKPYHAWLKNG